MSNEKSNLCFEESTKTARTSIEYRVRSWIAALSAAECPCNMEGRPIRGNKNIERVLEYWPSMNEGFSEQKKTTRKLHTDPD